MRLTLYYTRTQGRLNTATSSRNTFLFSFICSNNFSFIAFGAGFLSIILKKFTTEYLLDKLT